MKCLKHAIVIVHPDPKSFTATMGHTYAAAAKALGATVTVRDLYKMHFDPCLHIGELPRSTGYKTPIDVAAEREILRDVDVFAFFYPLWFNAPPAILKGYIDRVFGIGFGFEPRNGVRAPLLVGRKLISFTSSGAPEHWVRETGAFDALYTHFDRHIAAMCGLSVVAHHHFGDVTPSYTISAVNKAKNDVRAAVRRYFRGPRLTSPIEFHKRADLSLAPRRVGRPYRPLDR